MLAPRYQMMTYRTIDSLEINGRRDACNTPTGLTENTGMIDAYDYRNHYHT